MTNRIRTVNKHMADALNRESPLLWATRILNGEAEDDPDQDDGDDDVDESFDGEKKKKHRVKNNKMPDDIEDSCVIFPVPFLLPHFYTIIF